MWFYLLGIFQEYLVIINAYNGDLIPYFPEILEYCLVDLVMLILMFITIKKHDIIEFLSIITALTSKFQWIVHSPFEEWPKWWPASKSDNDIRHRVEYYDTHVMCFVIYYVLFIRSYDFIFKKRSRESVL
tara:strand:- start:1500 stop:1889 length:390 start_codon:yes stop_codon:yes gene_type:complete